jgi:hypothetical protein
MELNMSITSHLETAEEAVRQSLINALAEGDDQWLSELFDLLNRTGNLRKKVSNTIRFTDNQTQWAKDWSEYNFNLTSPRVSYFLKVSGADGITPAWFLASSQRASGGSK